MRKVIIAAGVGLAVFASAFAQAGRLDGAMNGARYLARRMKREAGPYVRESYRAARRFHRGYITRKGHVGDRLIEGLIEMSTPEADEQTREVQRNAIKFLLDPNPDRSRKHLRRMVNSAMAFGRGRRR